MGEKCHGGDYNIVNLFLLSDTVIGWLYVISRCCSKIFLHEIGLRFAARLMWSRMEQVFH